MALKYGFLYPLAHGFEVGGYAASFSVVRDVVADDVPLFIRPGTPCIHGFFPSGDG